MQNTKSDNIISQTRQDIDFVPPEYENDSRFVKSFPVDSKQEILDFFEEYGFVVVRDILTPAECQATIDEAFGILEHDGIYNRHDPSTWDQWPSSGMSKYGQVSRTPVFTTQAMLNRQNPNLHAAFSMFFSEEQKKELLVSHDRLCIYRPTKDVVFPDGSIKNVPRWKIPYNIHLDINPSQHASDNTDIIKGRWQALSYGYKFITENNIGHKNYPCLQGVLNLADNLEEDGGFVCVPGWTKVYPAWVEKNAQYLGRIDAPSVQFEANHWLNKYHKRISMRAGSIVIFDSRTAHGAAPNNSSNIRCAQFIKMFCVNDLNRCILPSRSSTLKPMISSNQALQQQLTPLGRSLFGIGEAKGNANTGGNRGGSTRGGGQRRGRGGGRVQGGGW